MCPYNGYDFTVDRQRLVVHSQLPRFEDGCLALSKADEDIGVGCVKCWKILTILDSHCLSRHEHIK